MRKIDRRPLLNRLFCYIRRKMRKCEKDKFVQYLAILKLYMNQRDPLDKEFYL